MDKNRQYKRKLSAEEIRENFILIQKRDLDFFPKVGKPFKLKIKGKNVETYIEAVECWCQGPQKPHSHHRINTKDFRDLLEMRWGQKLVIEKAGEKTYKIE